MTSESRHLISPKTTASARCVVFDCRFSLTDGDAGRRAYETAHIPGARFADLEQDLSRKSEAGGRHPLPDRDELAEKLRCWGVDEDSTVVCYDENSGAMAGRFWWLLRWLGHENVRLLDGGLDAWLAAGFATDDEPVEPERGNFVARAALTRLCAAADVGHSRAALLDARDAARYRGEIEPFDPVAGHIPGAISAPFTDNLVGGEFKSPAALKERFAGLGIEPDDDTICYCGSGVTAAHNVLALLIAGYREPILYAGSWSDWVSDSSRPIATA